MQPIPDASVSLRRQAERLRALHRAPPILVLVNAWDAVSARLVEMAGYPAVATTSGGVAFSLGYPDGERIPREEMLQAVGRIARAVSVPVTADLESGYGTSLEAIEATAQGLLDAGAVGLNLEDYDPAGEAFFDAGRQQERIRRVRAVGERAGVPVVINARTDAWWKGGGSTEERWREALRRGRAYREAGADCLFVPGLNEEARIRAWLAEIPGPLNVLAEPAMPAAPRLEALGVARLSMGSGGQRCALAAFRGVLERLKSHGDWPALENAIPYGELNGLVSQPPHERR